MREFVLTHGGLIFLLDIRNYQKNMPNYKDSWCIVNLKIESDYIHYVIADDEMLTCDEIETLISELNKFLNGEKTDYSELVTMEPDLRFVFDPPVKRLESGGEKELILEVQFRNGQYGAYTDNYLKLILDSEEVAFLRDYLLEVTGRKTA